ncbi:hypothetical protein Tco_1150347, partial [Tanacetum coccineum]
ISFPPLEEEDGMEGPMIIEAEMGGHFVHRMYVDGGSSSEILIDIDARKDRRRGTFNFRMDEFHGCKVAIFIQQNHRKAGGKDDPGSPIHSSRNAKITSDRRNGHITEQQDYSTRVAIHPDYPEQTIAIGSTLTEEGRKELCGLLRRNLDVFVWKPADMTGVSRHIAEHRLNIRE